MRFHDRSEAGRLLAAQLSEYDHRADVTVVALPRGGVPVGYEVARVLHAPLDVLVVRKLGMPGHEEFAIGAIASGNICLLDDEVIRTFGVTGQQVDAVVANRREELQRQEQLYRNCREPLQLRDRRVILIDDGLATGWTMRAAVLALRRQQPARIVVAVPVAAHSVCEELRAQADEVVCAYTPVPFQAVGQWYREFPQISDRLVCHLIAEAQVFRQEQKHEEDI